MCEHFGEVELAHVGDMGGNCIPSYTSHKGTESVRAKLIGKQTREIPAGVVIMNEADLAPHDVR